MTGPAVEVEPSVEVLDLPHGLVATLVLRDVPSDSEQAVNALLADDTDEDAAARRRRRGRSRARQAAGQQRYSGADDDLDA